ncbi:MAG: DUF5684 domain-containing protein [Bacteroidales bacterium]|jgi:hypothetical protein|nr:DUF5684 domain-containing protein [Bacteroidales bacterium]
MECFIENLESCDFSSGNYLVFLPFLIMWMIFGIYLSVIQIVSIWHVFTKAGKPGWACLIPVYDYLVGLKIIGKPWWWVILLFIPFVNLIFMIWGINLLAKSFGKKADFTIGLLLLPWIFFPILGFGKSEYNGPAGK